MAETLPQGLKRNRGNRGCIRVPLGVLNKSPRVQVPNNHILSQILTYITTILKPST